MIGGTGAGPRTRTQEADRRFGALEPPLRRFRMCYPASRWMGHGRSPVGFGGGYTRSEALGIPLVRSWREGGFVREMLRENAPTAPVAYGWRLDSAWMNAVEMVAPPAFPSGTLCWGLVG